MTSVLFMLGFLTVVSSILVFIEWKNNKTKNQENG